MKINRPDAQICLYANERKFKVTLGELLDTNVIWAIWFHTLIFFVPLGLDPLFKNQQYVCTIMCFFIQVWP